MVEQLAQEVSEVWPWMMNQLGWASEPGWFKISILVLAFIGVMVLLRRLLGGSSVGGGRGAPYDYSSGRHRGFPNSFYVGSRRLGDFGMPKEVYDFRVPSPKPDMSNLRRPLSLDLDTASNLFIPPTPGNPSRVARKGKESEIHSGSETKNPTVLNPTGVFHHPYRHVPEDTHESKVRNLTPGMSNLRRPASLDLNTARKLFVMPNPVKAEGGRGGSCSDIGDDTQPSGDHPGEGEAKVRRPDVELDLDLARESFIPSFGDKNDVFSKQ